MDIGKVTHLGPVVLRYAHLCKRVYADPHFPTFEGITQRLLIPQGSAGTMPAGTILAMRLEERGGAAGPRELTVVPYKDGAHNSMGVHQDEVRFELLEDGMPLVARPRLKLPALRLDGPGFYHFDFVVGNQFLGRLPVLVFDGKAMPRGRFDRGPLRGNFVSMEFGHVVERVNPPKHDDPEGLITFSRIMEAYPIAEGTGSFTITPSALVFGLSAPDTFPRNHRLAIQPRDGNGQPLIPAVELDFVLQHWLPGVALWIQSLSLGADQGPSHRPLLYGGPGDYDFLISVDGTRVGVIDFPIREVPNPKPH